MNIRSDFVSILLNQPYHAIKDFICCQDFNFAHFLYQIYDSYLKYFSSIKICQNNIYWDEKINNNQHIKSLNTLHSTFYRKWIVIYLNFGHGGGIYFSHGHKIADNTKSAVCITTGKLFYPLFLNKCMLWGWKTGFCWKWDIIQFTWGIKSADSKRVLVSW